MFTLHRVHAVLSSHPCLIEPCIFVFGTAVSKTREVIIHNMGIWNNSLDVYSYQLIQKNLVLPNLFLRINHGKLENRGIYKTYKLV